MTPLELQHQNLVVFDIDGTLKTAGGAIALEQLASLMYWGILSSKARENSRKCIGNLKPLFVENCRVNMRAEELKYVQSQYPDFDSYTYVADRDVDKQEALKAGWQFCFAHQWGLNG